MRRYLNQHNVPLSVAVYLATDTYDHDDSTISATALLKPTRQLILAGRIPQEQSLEDIMGLVKSRLGNSIHDGIEQAWLNGYDKALAALGHPRRVIERVVVNPDPATVTEDHIPVYLEQRAYRQIEGVTVSGKFDFVAEGRLEDFKNTSTFTWINNTKDDDYILQGSIYRWLNPEVVTQDEMQINFLFWDWQAGKARDPSYPPQPIVAKRFPLMSPAETEAFIRRKLREIAHYRDQPEPALPPCSDKELWRRDPEFKYYKNPDKLTRSTKNFRPSEFGSTAAAKQAAYSRLAKDGGTGTVIEVPGQVMACKYCPAFTLCSQKDQLIADGSLQL